MTSDPEVIIIDDDDALRESLTLLLATANIRTIGFASAEEFLTKADRRSPACLLLDIRLPGMSGLELQTCLAARGARDVVVLITGHGDVAMAVSAMRAGAYHFVEKPYEPEAFLAIVHEALSHLRTLSEDAVRTQEAYERHRSLTPREQDVFALLVDGRPSKTIAHELGISTRTAEHHRSAVMKKLGAASLSHLVRMALTLSKLPT